MTRDPVSRLAHSVPAAAALNSGPNGSAVSPGLPKCVPGYAAIRKGRFMFLGFRSEKTW